MRRRERGGDIRGRRGVIQGELETIQSDEIDGQTTSKGETRIYRETLIALPIGMSPLSSLGTTLWE